MAMKQMMKWLGFILLVGQVGGIWPVSAASIVGSPHDLSAVYWIKPESGLSHSNWQLWADYGQVCIYCHTPHHADPSQGPLWNRTAYVTSYQTYVSDNVTAGQPGKASLICLSCHDGTISVDAVLNMPGSGLQWEWYNPGSEGIPAADSFMRKQLLFHGDSSCYTCHQPGGPTGVDLSASLITTDLRDDHPVGFTYPVGKPGLATPPANGVFPNGVRLINGKVECLSCHQPHDPANRPFLVTSNAGSALCLTCHLKE